MRSLVFLLLCVCALPACKTTRTVIAGPQNISSGSSDYDPRKEALSEQVGRQAASSGVSGQFGGGGSSFNRRFGSHDPHGYGSEGLNAMNEKVYGGNAKTQELKSFSQTKDFLTKRYANTGELDQKESFTQRMKSWFGGKTVSSDKLARETGQDSRDASRILENTPSPSDGRTVGERRSRDDGRVAGTKDYYPAKKVLDEGADAPHIIGQSDKQTNDAVWKLIKSRPRDNPATVEDIRQLLGKTE